MNIYNTIKAAVTTRQAAEPPTQSHIPKSDAELFREKEQFCIRVLGDYLRLLRYWKLRYVPESPGDSYDDRFVEACQMESIIAHLSDEMRKENVSRRKRIIVLLEQDNRIYDLENYVSRRKEEEMQLEGE